MKNASVRNLLFVFATLVVAAALSLGAFAGSAQAETWSDYDFGGDGWSDYNFDSWSDYNYDNWSDYNYDSWSNYDYDNWSDYNYDNWSDYNYDTWSNYDYDNWSDYNYDNWSDYDYDNWSDYSYTNDYELYNNDYELYNNDYELYNNDYELYNNDYELYNNDYELYGQEQVVYDSFGQSYSIPSFGGGGFTLVPPTYSMPTPRPTPTYPTPRPQPPVYVPPAPTPVTNNNCVNNSCNNTNTNINNVNTNTNVTTVNPATPGPIVQYVAPQYPVYPQYYNQAPYCYITIGQSYYSSGMITLTWSSQGATSAYITPQVGQVAPNGSTSLYAYGNTVYSLTVTGPGGTYTCRTQSYAAPYAPVSPYVSLSQIPYTGITMGPIASAMYWTGMIALAIAGAYLLVYYKGGALALATSMISTGKRDAHDEATVLHEEVTHAAPVLPTTQGSAMTRDAMKIVRSEDGTPRLVISRS